MQCITISIGVIMFKYRLSDEIIRKLNKMEPPSNLKFNIDAFPIQEDAMFHISKD